MNYTSVTVEGFITQNFELKKTKTGKAVCSFTIAIQHFSSPEADPKVSFVEIEAWAKLADYCGEHLRKGKRVLVIGALRQDRWEDNEGKHRSKLKIIANQIRMLDLLTQKTAIEKDHGSLQEATL